MNAIWVFLPLVVHLLSIDRVSTVKETFLAGGSHAKWLGKRKEEFLISIGI